MCHKTFKRYYRECKKPKGCGCWFYTTHRKGGSCPECQKKNKKRKCEILKRKRKVNILTTIKGFNLTL